MSKLRRFLVAAACLAIIICSMPSYCQEKPDAKEQQKAELEAKPADSKSKLLYGFEKDTQGWWTFKKEAEIDLSVAKRGAEKSSGALEVTFTSGGGKSYLGAGIETKYAMEKEPWKNYAGGHMSISLKGDVPLSVRVELRSKGQGSFVVPMKVQDYWVKYYIPFSQFKSGEKVLDLAESNIDEIVIIPSARAKQKHSLLVDNIILSPEEIKLPPPISFSVAGKVQDASGKPVSGAAVLLASRYSKIAEAQSGNDGVFSISSTAQLHRFISTPTLDSATDIDAMVTADKPGLLSAYSPVKIVDKLNLSTFCLILATAKSVEELKVDGNRLKTAGGSEKWLQGVCVDSLEWSASGDNVLQSISIAIDLWKSNCIRLPMKDSFWFGREDGQKDGGEAYRKLIDSAIETCAKRGAYLVLDLHRFGSSRQEHVEFWKDAATRYKDNPAVLFELFNEPHGISWDMWRNGGDLKDPNKKNTDVNAAENTEKQEGTRSPGMQALVDAIRATGAKNIIIAGGLDWGYDLSGIMNGSALDDKGGNGIMYSSHVYPWKSDWAGKTLIAAEKYPLFIGEVGCQPEPMPWQKSTEDPKIWAPDMIGFIQKNKLNWTGFSFHPGCGPRAILDWQYTPSPYWGAYVKEALSGKQFEMKKMR
ncbi:MAG TPA: hypothetical protein DCZ94_18705 [Lentisphaeria bacterium]|nr:MAG: hypothetical protein A2X48_05965 [Lentisphaerae bacterium GWF2_49_21]HBC88977.1 hypothetical protein [Lentisphaeria bacterium]